MSEVFISYARSTEDLAEQLADAFRELGHDVWRDDLVPVHRAYGEVIEERLHLAKAVVVIWSADALQSVWVRSEADRARLLSKLVQLSVDNSRLPMPFDQIQCADLSDWAGDRNHRGFRKVVASIAQLVGDRPAAPAETPASAPTPTAQAPAPAAPLPTIDAPPPAAAAPIVEPQPAAAAEAPPASADEPLVAAPAEADPPPQVDLPRETAAADASEPAAAAPEIVQPSLEATPPQAPMPAVEPDPVAAASEALAVVDEPLAPTVPPEAPSAAPAQVVQAKRSGPPMAMIALGALAAVAVVGGGVWIATGGLASHAPAATATAPTAPKPAPGAPAGPTPLSPANQQIAQAADALADDARSQGRPAGEAASLTQLASQIDGELAQLQSAPASQAVTLTTQLNQTATQGAQAEAAALSHSGATLSAEAESTLKGGDAPPAATTALAALHGSTQTLDAAAASVSSAADAASALAALHAELTDWGQVRTDYAAAAALFAPALKARFQAAADAARAEAQRVIGAAANASKPWFLASRADKDAYKLLQDHAAEAKTDLGELDSLAQDATGSDVRQLRAAITRAGDIRASLAALAAAAPSAPAPHH